MNKIGVILTGGTPTCEETNTGRSPGDAEAFRDKLITILEGRSGVDILNLLNVDSSDFRPEEHCITAGKINELKDRGYKGLVFIHGTDTNAYTLASHSYMVKGLSFPVIHTGSSIPLEKMNSDFPRNFGGAIDAILEDELYGTYLFFGDNLYLGNRVSKQYTDSFKPFVNPRSDMTFGIMGGDARLHIDPYFRAAINEAHMRTSQVVDIDTNLETQVDSVKLTPHTDYAIFDFFRERGKKGILIEGFGDGNVPTRDDFQQAVKRCIDSGMIILLGSQCLYGTRHYNYEGGKKLLDSGAIAIAHLTNEAAISKMAWALHKYSGDVDRITKVMTSDVNGDMITK